jgi:glucose/mannose transport system permease protein
MSAPSSLRTPWLPKLVVAPSFALSLFFIYGLILWNAYLSVSASRLLPNYTFAGFEQYALLWESERFRTAAANMAVFGGLFIGGAMGLGLLLAILLDQKIRGEGVLRTVYLYPMAISFIVTGTAWKWMLNPGLGLEHLMHQWGFTGFSFDWLINPDKAIYCVAIAGMWQSAGFVMALFLAAGWRIIIPSLRPVFFSTLMVVSHLAIKSFDLVMALTNGGPGYATDLPATFMYTMAFSRGQIGQGAAAATVMLVTVAAIVVPYLYSELRVKK